MCFKTFLLENLVGSPNQDPEKAADAFFKEPEDTVYMGDGLPWWLRW